MKPHRFVLFILCLFLGHVPYGQGIWVECDLIKDSGDQVESHKHIFTPSNYKVKHDPQPEDRTVDACGKYAHKRMAYAYYKESALTGCTADAITFFSSSEAKKYYKRKLRYLIARYGYSTRITNLIFISEANGVGWQSANVEFWQGITGYPQRGAYEGYPENQQKVGDWHIEMAQFIKQSLGHTRHLIGSSYAGPAPKDTELCTSVTTARDRTYESEHIDFISFSSYRNEQERWRRWSDRDFEENEWYQLYPWVCYQDGATNPYNLSNKPVIHSEQGPGNDYNEYDYTISSLDPWISGFSGFASSGMNWGKMYNNSSWLEFGKIKSFFENIIFYQNGLHITPTNWETYWSIKQITSEKRLEAFYLYSEQNDKAYGLLLNCSWNPRTGPARLPEYMNYDDYYYNNYMNALEDWIPSFNEIEHSTLHDIKLSGFQPCSRYRITYFDPDNPLNSIHIDYDGTFGNKLALKGFPTLSYERPFLLFYATRIDECLIQPLTDHEYYLSKNETKSPYDLETLVSEIGSLEDFESVSLFGLDGKLVSELKTRNDLVQITNLCAPGIYFLRYTRKSGDFLIKRVVLTGSFN
jgi:hypothetical protein